MSYIGLEGFGPKALPPQIVQFGSDTYYCDEAEGKVEIQLCRLGIPDVQVSVDFKTVEGSAKENLKFKPLSGSVIFDVGDYIKTITVDLVDNNCFDATLEFEMHLFNPTGCILGQYLYKTRVLIADDDAFPTNRYKIELRSRRISEIPDWSLMVEYWKMNLQDGLIWNAAWKNMIGDQFVNLHKVFVFWVQSYLVRNLMEDKSYRIQIRSVVVFCLVHFVPAIVTWYLDKRKVARRIQGKAINKLQSNLLRKFFYYEEAARNVVSVSDLTMAIARDVPELVQMGFASIFDFLEKVGLLVVLIILCCTQQRAGGIWSVALLVMTFPLLLVLFIGLRQAGTGKRHRALFRSQTSVVGFIQEATEGYRLIADYFQRPRMVGVFTNKIVAWNKAATNARLWECTNMHFAPILTAIFISLFVILNFNDVVAQPTVAPSFMVSIGAMKEIGQCYQTLYEDLLAMQHAIAPLQNIVFYMNLPVDIGERLCHHRAMIEQSDVSRRQASLRGLGPEEITEKKLYTEDLIPISGEDVTFAYPRFSGGGVHVFENATFQIDQGDLVAVAGTRGSGKATLLGLLGGVLIPREDCGSLFVPPHLRVLHVSYTPQMVPELNLWENLTFGPSDDDDECPERVLRICQRLGVSEEIVDMIGHELRIATSIKPQPSCPNPPKVTNFLQDLTEASSKTASMLVPSLGSSTRTSWEKRRISMMNKPEDGMTTRNDALSLSYTDKSLIHLARGLVMNPEVLVIHKPLAHFGDVFSAKVLSLLREFVDQRGLEKPADELLLRRPRTCIISVSALKGLEVADVVLRVSQNGIERVDMSMVANHRADVISLFRELDANEDGHVSLQEFVDGMCDKPSRGHFFGIPASCFSTVNIDRDLMEVFAAMDTDNVKRLSFEQMLSFTKNLADYVLDEKSGSVVSRKCTVDSRTTLRASLESNKGAEALGGAPQQPLVSTSVAKSRPLSDDQSRSHWFKKVEIDRKTTAGGHVHNTRPVTYNLVPLQIHS